VPAPNNRLRPQPPGHPLVVQLTARLQQVKHQQAFAQAQGAVLGLAHVPEMLATQPEPQLHQAVTGDVPTSHQAASDQPPADQEQTAALHQRVVHVEERCGGR